MFKSEFKKVRLVDLDQATSTLPFSSTVWTYKLTKRPSIIAIRSRLEHPYWSYIRFAKI